MRLLQLKLNGIVLLLILFGCNQSNQKKTGLQKYVRNSGEQWLSVLERTGFQSEELNNTVLLVTYSTHCPACLQELDFWDEYHQKNSENIDIFLVVIERYGERFENFLIRNDLNLPSYQDESGAILKEDLVPFLPVKIYFNNDGMIRRIHHMGNDKNIDDFLGEFS